MHAALAKRHADAEPIVRSAIAARIAGDEEEHSADVLLRMLSEMAGIVDALEAGMGLFRIQHSPEKPPLEGLVLLRLAGASSKRRAGQSQDERGEERDPVHGRLTRMKDNPHRNVVASASSCPVPSSPARSDRLCVNEARRQNLDGFPR
jgi:hypothetical protein